MKTKEDYQIVPYESKIANGYRLAIADKNGKILDTANGYGYKSTQNAHKALSWKFLGGKDKAKQRKSKFEKWENENPTHKAIIKEFQNWIESCFKEVLRGETDEEYIWEQISKKYSDVKIPDFVKDQILKIKY